MKDLLRNKLISSYSLFHFKVIFELTNLYKFDCPHNSSNYIYLCPLVCNSIFTVVDNLGSSTGLYSI